MNAGTPTLSYVADAVRRYDRDRFLTALFAPAERREHLMALYAFNLEIAKTREAVSEPVIGLMRLQWWRDALAQIYESGQPPHHAVAEALAAAIATHRLDRAGFERLIEARERDLEDTTFASLGELERYAEETTAPLFGLGLAVLGVQDPDDEAIRKLSVGYALCGLVRAVPFLLRARRIVIPDDLIARHAVDLKALLALKPAAGLTAAVETLCGRAGHLLAEGRAARPRRARGDVPIMLNGRVAEHYLGRLRRAGYNPFDPELATRPAMLAATLWLRAAFNRP